MTAKQEEIQTSSVFVKCFFCEALLSWCKATLPCRNFIQMPMLQPHMNKIRITMYGAQKYTAWLYEIKKTILITSRQRLQGESVSIPYK